MAAKQLEEVTTEAAKEEKCLAEERGDYHQGVPAITVIVDGGWSKRSHSHPYNAKSGVWISNGQATGKLLHIGGLGTSTAQVAPKESHQISIPAIKTGPCPPLRRKLISSWRDSNRLSRCMESDIRDMSGMETTLCIQH